MILNPDHVTIAVADAGTAIKFFALLGFRKDHVATIDGGVPARYMGMPGMKAQHITLVLEGERRRTHPAEHVQRNAERGQARQQGTPVGVRTPRHHLAAGVEQPQCARGVIGAAADLRRATLDPVDRQIPDDRKHGRPFSAFGRRDDASACEEADDRRERKREREARQRRADLRMERMQPRQKTRPETEIL